MTATEQRAMPLAAERDGSVRDFAREYPEVMIVLLGIILTVLWFYIRKDKG